MTTLKFLVIADSFGTLVREAIETHMETIQDCDAILGLGDMPATAYPTLRQELGLKMRGFCVLGNHDGADWPDWLSRYRFEHLHDQVSNFTIGEMNISIGGFSGCEAYAPGKPWQWTDNEAAAVLRKMPYCDILLTHTAPEHPEGAADDPRHRGLPAIGQYIQKHRPHLSLHGHFHHNYQKRVGRTLVAGCFGAAIVTCETEQEIWRIETKPIVKFPWT